MSNQTQPTSRSELKDLGVMFMVAASGAGKTTFVEGIKATKPPFRVFDLDLFGIHEPEKFIISSQAFDLIDDMARRHMILVVGLGGNIDEFVFRAQANENWLSVFVDIPRDIIARNRSMRWESAAARPHDEGGQTEDLTEFMEEVFKMPFDVHVNSWADAGELLLQWTATNRDFELIRKGVL